MPEPNISIDLKKDDDFSKILDSIPTEQMMFSGAGRQKAREAEFVTYIRTWRFCHVFFIFIFCSNAKLCNIAIFVPSYFCVLIIVIKRWEDVENVKEFINIILIIS